MPSEKDDYKIGTIEVPDMENYPKPMSIEEFMRERARGKIIVTKIRGSRQYFVTSFDCSDSCGCGGC